MSTRPFHKFRPGQQELSAAELNRLTELAEISTRMIPGRGVSVRRTSQGTQIDAVGQTWFWAKITATNGATPPGYSWSKLVEDPVTQGNLIADPDGMVGTPAAYPAFELAGATVPVDGSAIVQLLPSAGGDFYWFRNLGAGGQDIDPGTIPPLLAVRMTAVPGSIAGPGASYAPVALNPPSPTDYNTLNAMFDGTSLTIPVGQSGYYDIFARLYVKFAQTIPNAPNAYQVLTLLTAGTRNVYSAAQGQGDQYKFTYATILAATKDHLNATDTVRLAVYWTLAGPGAVDTGVNPGVSIVEGDLTVQKIGT